MSDSERVPLPEVRDLIVVGEALPFRVLDDPGRLLLNQGQVVSTERQFEQLVERGAWVERPLVEKARAERAAAAGKPVIVAERKLTLFDLWEKVVWSLDDCNRRLVKGGTSAAELEQLGDRLLALVDREPDIALFLCMRQDDKRFALYALTHGVHTAVIAAFAARQLGWPAARVNSLVRAALTMNAALGELQGQLAEQRDPPSKKQFDQVRAHPHAGAELLRKAGVADTEWLDAVTHHHERADGSGYPSGTREVGEAAQLLRAADVFMAKLSPRATRGAMVPQLAARQLFQQAGGAPLATALIRAIGVHPPGSIVQLASGEVGVVSHRPKPGAGIPTATLTNKQGKPVADTHHRDTALPEFAITGPVTDTKPYGRILPERIYGMLLA